MPIRTTDEIRADLERNAKFPDSPCVCNAGCDGCMCTTDERALRNISSCTWPHGAMTESQREWCARKADRAGEGAYKYSDLIQLSDRDLAHDTLSAWADYARSQGLL